VFLSFAQGGYEAAACAHIYACTRIGSHLHAHNFCRLR
jgi:hypothetical protein